MRTNISKIAFASIFGAIAIAPSMNSYAGQFETRTVENRANDRNIAVCSEGVLALDEAEIERLTENLVISGKNNEAINIRLLRVAGLDKTCPLMIEPTRRILSLEEYEKLTTNKLQPSQNNSIHDLINLASSEHRFSKKVGKGVCRLLNFNSSARLYAGYCGQSAAPIGTVYFLSNNLAITSGVPTSSGSAFCIQNGFSSSPIYHDVHMIRRIGAGNEQIAGLSLMRQAPATGDIQIVTGPLVSPQGVAFTLQVDGDRRCQNGGAREDNGILVSFLGALGTAPWLPTPIAPGGPARLALNPSPPFGVHVITGQRSYFDQFGSPVREIHPVIRRYLQSELPIINNWIASSAPPGAQNVTISYPQDGQMIDSTQSLNVSVNSQASYRLELDGNAFSGAVSNISPGWHTLVAINAGSPNYRHTIRFEAKPLSTPADSYESDNIRDDFSPLFAGSPQSHNFHQSDDVDWMAFAVEQNTRSTVILSGAVSANSQLKLYKQLNYPNGSIDLVGMVENSGGQLVLTDIGAGVGVIVYYVEAQPTSAAGSGPGSKYSVSVNNVPLPDQFEFDGQIDYFSSLYEGVPQSHTFHLPSDNDWTAFAVGGGVTSRVDLTGSPAQYSQIDLYRQLNYPNGSIDLVGTNAQFPTTLSVQDTAPSDQALVVYYVLSKPFNLSPDAARSTYTLSVHTQ